MFPNFQVRFSHSDQAQFIRTLIDGPSAGRPVRQCSTA